MKDLPRWRAGTVALLAGTASMVAELAAVRLQAPHFGDSAYVWTNVIGVILGALAVGAVLGGRLARRTGAQRWAAGLLAGAGLGLGVAPFLSGWVGPWLLPGDLPLDAAMPAMVRGSFVATATLFALPLVALGALGPLLVALLAQAGEPVGRSAGLVSAAGTIGSLCGTFACTHWLVPAFGCRATLVGAGGVLWLAAAFAWPGRRGAVLLCGSLLLGAASAVPCGPLRPPGPGRELLAEVESRQQFLQVVRERPPDGPERTLLLLNEGLDSFHSVAVAGSALTGGAYYDWHALAPWFATWPADPRAGRVLSIGDAAGTLRTVYAAVHPGATVDAVDFDAAAMELGDRWFPGPKAHGARWPLDGRLALERAPQRWHVIHVDAYAHQVYVPAHLASREFFTAAFAHLEPGGVLACNVGGLRHDDPVLTAVGSTIASVFGHARALQVPRSRNFLVLAVRGEPPDPTRLSRPTAAGAQLDHADAEAFAGLRGHASEPQRWRELAGTGPVLADDRPQLDALFAASYVERRGERGVVACTGSLPPDAAEVAAQRAALLGDWPAVLAAVATSRQATVRLREFAGDAQWSLRQLAAAAAEYAAGNALANEAAQRQRFAARQAVLAEDLAAEARAEDLAARNGWLALACCGLLTAALWWACRSADQATPAP